MTVLQITDAAPVLCKLTNGVAFEGGVAVRADRGNSVDLNVIAAARYVR
jgi:hypothetical protein